jgi:putative nucleotidyltransferase with HDIG domain
MISSLNDSYRTIISVYGCDPNPNQNILILSAYSDAKYFMESIEISVDGYILKPFSNEQFVDTMYKIAYKITQFNENKIYRENLEKLVEERTHEILKLQNEKISNYEKTLFALVDMVEARDAYTGNHSKRVAFYSKLIAKEMGLSDDECEDIYMAGILHDIGKIAIPDTILLKPGMLNSGEYNLIKEHVNLGYSMLIELPMFSKFATIIKAHHERLDGSGYPDGLQGDEINLLSNIMAVADSFDAMTTSRIYKSSKSVEEALDEIEKLKNIHFREEIVTVALKVLKDIQIDTSINQLPSNELEQERLAYFHRDQLTRSYNHNYLEILLYKNQFSLQYHFIHLIQIHHFTKYNDKYGWEMGDEFLIRFNDLLKEKFPTALIFRIYGDDFALLCEDDLEINPQEIISFVEENFLEVVYQKIDLITNKIFTLKELEILAHHH